MGNTCKSDFCVGNEQVSNYEVPPLRLRESNKNTRESDGPQKLGRFPDLTP